MFSIKLDREIYYVGSQIKGTFSCNISCNKSIKGIKVELVGLEQTEWQEIEQFFTLDDCGKTKTGPVRYAATSEILREEVTLYNGGALAAGRYDFDFNFKLPDVIPSSCKGSYGCIQYFIVGQFEGRIATQHTKAQFSVLNLTHLDTLTSSYHSTYSVANEIRNGYYCCSRNAIMLEMTLEKQAFYLGELANINIKLTNRSKASPKYIKLELIQVITASMPHSPDMIKAESTVLSNRGIEVNDMLKGDHVYHAHLQIPYNINIYNFTGSNLWKAEYAIRATCKFSDSAVNISVEMTPILGVISIEQMPGISPYSSLPKLHKSLKIMEE